MPSQTPKSAKLYYYTDWKHFGWFGSLDQFRKHFGVNSSPVRVCAPEDEPAPPGYRKTGRGLANDPAERIPTMRDLVREL